jgi:hypothetical protein
MWTDLDVFLCCVQANFRSMLSCKGSYGFKISGLKEKTGCLSMVKQVRE